MKTQTLKTRVTPTPPATKKSSTQTRETAAPWQASFTKRLPHRLGEPLSSGGGGDGGISV